MEARLELAHPITHADTDSFAVFYRSNREPVARALALTLGDADLAAEATHEAMIRALQRWRKVAGYGNPEGWVYRVGLNWARSWLRTRRRRRTDPVPLPEVAVAAAPIADPAVAAALAELTIDHRAVVVLRIYLDWSTDRTAAALGVPPGTVKSRLSRALDQLRDRLSEDDR